MHGSLAQTAALAAHAKAHVLDPQLGGDDAYWTAHSTFKNVKTLRFVVRKRTFFRGTEAEVATTPRGWMATLPRAAVINLIVLRTAGPLPPHVACAFVGGTQEGIAVSADDSSGVWIPTWKVTRERYPQQGIWQVRYALDQAPPEASVRTTVTQARERLGKILREADNFAAAEAGLSRWCEDFWNAGQALVAPNPTAPYYPDILPPVGYTLAARQLLAAAVRGYVFGGMGSWNDWGPASEKARPDYNRLSEELYAAVTDGVAIAVNAGMEVASPPGTLVTSAGGC